MNQILQGQSVQGNKVSVNLDQDEVKIIKLDNQSRSRKDSRSFAKSPKPESNILNDGKKKSSFEDSRITMILFEKYKTVELARFFTVSATIVLTVLEYEYSYSTQLTLQLEEDLTLILYLMMAMTILSIILTFVSYQVLMAYQKEAQMITPQASLVETPLIWGIICEIIMIVVTPTPYTRYQKVTFLQRYSDNLRFYFVNEILTFISLYKGFILLNIMFKFQQYYSSRIGRVCRLYSTNFDTHLMLKLCIKNSPFQTLSVLFATGMFVFGYSLEVAERALFRSEDTIDPQYVGTVFWIDLITIFTVGYGDFFPQTDLGRLAMSFSVVYGVAVTSLFTAMFYSLLTPFSSECLVWAVLDKADARKKIQGASGGALKKLNTLITLKQTLSSVDQAPGLKIYVEQLHSSLAEITTLKRIYRDIDGEEFMAMVKRKFKDMNGLFEDVVEILDKLKIQQQQIMFQMFKPEKSLNSISKPPVREQSKDSEFFNNLDDTSNDPLLMRFQD